MRSAVEHWTLAVSAEPNDAEIHFLLAAALHVLRDFDNSASEYRTTIRLMPCYLEAHLDFAELLVRDALDRLRDTGQFCTLGEALQGFGYYRDVLTSLATCEQLLHMVEEPRALLSRRQLERLLGDEMKNATPVGGATGAPVYRPPYEWLRCMGFGPDEIIKLPPKGLTDRLADFVDGRTAVYVLGYGAPQQPQMLKLLKERELPHAQISTAMKDNEIQGVIRNLAPGEILLASMRRVALGRDFPWVCSESITRFVLVVLDPEFLLFPELLGTLARTSTLPSVERVQLFVDLSY
jgi:hypothetical protein